MEYNVNNLLHKGLSGIEAEKRLIDKGSPGSFLLRNSNSTPGHFTLSVRRNNSFAHVRIHHNGGFFKILENDKFKTLSDLVNYYYKKNSLLHEKNGVTIELLYPLFVDDHNLENSRWFHGQLTAKEAHSILLKKGKIGSFLVRESTRNLGAYVISVVTCTKKISHITVFQNKYKKFNIGGGVDFNNVAELIQFYGSPMMDKDGCVICLKQPLCVTRVNLTRLKQHIAQLEKQPEGSTCSSGFLEEFKELYQGNSEAPRNDGKKESNCQKNRYKHILPFDATRVILQDCDANDPSSDYINASYVFISSHHTKNNPQMQLEIGTELTNENRNRPNSSTAFDSAYDCELFCSPKFIATQGPLPNTIIDFWNMIWQEKSSVIVMLTKEIQSGREQSCRYWPSNVDETIDLPMHTGSIRVHLVSEQHLPTYVIRELTIIRQLQPQLLDFSNNLKVHQFHFIDWPEYGIPMDPCNYLNFLSDISTHRKSQPVSGPIVAHCNSGIGRTGTFIVIDVLINYIKHVGLHADIDVPNTVQIFREQRSGMVQTEAQYRFIYIAIQEYVLRLQRGDYIRNSLKKYNMDYINLKNTSKEYCQTCFKSPSSLPISNGREDWASSNFGPSESCPLPVNFCNMSDDLTNLHLSTSNSLQSNMAIPPTIPPRESKISPVTNQTAR